MAPLEIHRCINLILWIVISSCNVALRWMTKLLTSRWFVITAMSYILLEIYDLICCEVDNTETIKKFLVLLGCSSNFIGSFQQIHKLSSPSRARLVWCHNFAKFKILNETRYENCQSRANIKAIEMDLKDFTFYLSLMLEICFLTDETHYISKNLALLMVLSMRVKGDGNFVFSITLKMEQ